MPGSDHWATNGYHQQQQAQCLTNRIFVPANTLASI